MPSALLSPGVYIEEVPSGVRPIPQPPLPAGVKKDGIGRTD